MNGQLHPESLLSVQTMNLSNSFGVLDPRNPGFIGLESESEIDSVSDDRRDDVHYIRSDAMEVDEGIENEQPDHQHTIFFLYCRIALDSCGQVIARSQKEIEIQLTYKKATRNNPPNTNKTRQG